uniref:Uncharacterized protein n=1 Tax=Vitis vinifera TaxID=29760 RepID=A5BVH9_VITVI|nr:hypothetical protein VITISV_005972 [Vitis vinifera]
MARTRGAKSSSSSPSTRLRIPRESRVQDATPEPPRPSVVPSPIEDAPMSPPMRRYQTRRSLTMARASSCRGQKSGSGPPKKKAKPQPSQPPTTESQIPSGMTHEVVIRRPMVTQPPIEALDFYQSMTTHQFQNLTVIHFTIDGRHGILGARHIVEALCIPYEPPRPEDFRVWTHPAQSDIVHILSRRASSRQYLLRKELPPSMFFIDTLLRHNIFPLQHWVQRRGVFLEALFRISEGFFFGPHHLIMVALLYFEEKVHRKKLLRADAIPLLFPRLLCQILEHLGYPTKPQLERRCICREIFTLDKWTSMTTYGADQGAQVGPKHPEQPDEP